MKPEMTERQRKVYDFIGTFCRKHGYSPSFREIMRGVGAQNQNSVAQHLAALRTKGMVTMIPGRSRTVRIVKGAKAS